MISHFTHKGLEAFYNEGRLSGVQPSHSRRLRLILARLSAIYHPEDMNLPGFHFHKLSGKKRNFFSVKVNKNWRVIFEFDGKSAYNVDYVDYH
jgi:proteic killer suppression protein